MKERKFIEKHLYIKRPESRYKVDSGLTYFLANYIILVNDVQDNMLTND